MKYTKAIFSEEKESIVPGFINFFTDKGKQLGEVMTTWPEAEKFVYHSSRTYVTYLT